MSDEDTVDQDLANPLFRNRLFKAYRRVALETERRLYEARRVQNESLPITKAEQPDEPSPAAPPKSHTTKSKRKRGCL